MSNAPLSDVEKHLVALRKAAFHLQAALDEFDAVDSSNVAVPGIDLALHHTRDEIIGLETLIKVADPHP